MISSQACGLPIGLSCAHLAAVPSSPLYLLNTPIHSVRAKWYIRHVHDVYCPIGSNECLSVLRAFACVSSHTILDGTNIEDPDVILDMSSGLVQDFQRQEMLNLTADLLEFRRMQGFPVEFVVEIYSGRLDTGVTAHLQSRRKAIITHESQKFSHTSTTTVILFHSFIIDPHPSITATTSTPLHLPSFSLLHVDIFNLDAGNALSLVWLGDSEGSNVNRRSRVSAKSGDTGGSSSA